MRKVVFSTLIMTLLLLSSGCVMEKWFGKDVNLKSTPASEVSIEGIVNIPDDGLAGKIMGKMRFKVRSGVTVYLLDDKISYKDILSYGSKFIKSVVTDKFGKYRFSGLNTGSTYYLVFDVDNDGIIDDVQADVVVGSAMNIETFVRELNPATTNTSIFTLSNGKELTHGQTLTISLKGYVSSEKKVRIVIWNEKTTGKLMWESAEKTVNDDVTESFTHIIPSSWPSTGSQSGAEYKAFAMIGDDFFSSSEFVLSGTNEGDSTAPVVANPVFTFGILTSSSAVVNWSKASDDSSDIANIQYQLFYSTSNNLTSLENIEKYGSKIGTYTKDVTTKKMTGLSPDTTYYFNVIAMDEAGNKTEYTAGTAKTAISAAPVFSSSTISNNNSYIDITFNKALYNSNAVTGALDASDFSATFTKNGDLITNVTISSIKKDDSTIEGTAADLSGGESTIRFFIALANPPSDGLATVEIKPVDSTSIFDVDGVGMLNTQTTGTITMNDNATFGIESGTVASDNTYIDLVLTDPGYNTNGGAGAIEANDFTLIFAQGDDDVTDVTIDSIKQIDDSPLVGGESTIRVFLDVTNGPSTGDATIAITPVDNSSIFTATGSVMAASKTTGIKALNDLKSPLISSGTVSADNTYIDVVLSENGYSTNGGSGALVASDFELTFVKNGDDVTNVEIDSVKQNDNTIEGSASELVGGETTIRVFLTVTNGPSAGFATIEIKPVDASSIYDASGNAMDIAQTTCVQALIDLKNPLIISSGTVSDTNTYIDIVLSEKGYNTNGGSGALEVSDFALNFIQNGDDVSNIVILSVKKDDDIVEGLASDLDAGDTTIRIFLTVTNGPSTGDASIEIKPEDSSSIYDAVGNAMETTQTTGVKYLKDLKPSSIESASFANDNTYIDLTFSEGIYGDDSQSAAVEVADFAETYTIGGDTVANVEINSVKQNNNAIEGSALALVGGETVIRAFLTITNPPSNGAGTLEIKPTNSTSIYDPAGNATVDTETTGAIALNEPPPKINSGTLASDNSYIDVVFSKGVYRDAGSNSVELSDFLLTYTANSDDTTDVTISSIKKNDNIDEASASALSGGESTIRIFFTLSGIGSNALGTVNIKPADGSSIFDSNGTGMLDSETTGSKTLNDQNLLLANDSGFEAFAGVTDGNWSEQGTPADVLSSTNFAKAGTKSMENLAPVDDYSGVENVSKLPVSGSKTYTFTVWALAEAGVGDPTDSKIYFTAKWYIGAASNGTNTFGYDITALDTWQEVTMTKSKPGSDGLIFNFKSKDDENTNHNNIYFDEARIVVNY